MNTFTLYVNHKSPRFADIRKCTSDAQHALGVPDWQLPPWHALEYDLRMKLLAGTVKEGKVVLSGASLPEGTMVAVYAPEQGAAVRLPAHLQAELEEALAEADREEGISAEELFSQIEKYR